jgi:hypothetical protein
MLIDYCLFPLLEARGGLGRDLPALFTPVSTAPSVGPGLVDLLTTLTNVNTEGFKEVTQQALQERHTEGFRGTLSYKWYLLVTPQSAANLDNEHCSH